MWKLSRRALWMGSMQDAEKRVAQVESPRPTTSFRSLSKAETEGILGDTVLAARGKAAALLKR